MRKETLPGKQKTSALTAVEFLKVFKYIIKWNPEAWHWPIIQKTKKNLKKTELPTIYSASLILYNFLKQNISLSKVPTKEVPKIISIVCYTATF